LSRRRSRNAVGLSGTEEGAFKIPILYTINYNDGRAARSAPPVQETHTHDGSDRGSSRATSPTVSWASRPTDPTRLFCARRGKSARPRPV